MRLPSFSQQGSHQLTFTRKSIISGSIGPYRPSLWTMSLQYQCAWPLCLQDIDLVNTSCNNSRVKKSKSLLFVIESIVEHQLHETIKSLHVHALGRTYYVAPIHPCTDRICDSIKGMAIITKVMLPATSFTISWSLFLPANSSRYTYLVTTIKDNTTLYK